MLNEYFRSPSVPRSSILSQKLRPQYYDLALLFDLLRPHDFAPRRERERFLDRERERILERERERFLPPLEHERFLERERERFDRDLLLPPRERERFLEPERDRGLPPLEHDLFLDRDLDRILPERDRFFEPERDFDLDFERDLEQLLALSAIAARRFLAMAFGQEL